ncbi:NADP(+)-dependent 2-alkenal reductase-like protein [Tanacetum coccineum]
MGGGAGVAAATMVESKEWYLAAYAPENVPTSEHIKLRTVNVSLEYDSIPDQHVLVQLLMITVDPYLRNVITGRDGDLYLPQIPLNKVLTEFGIARVVRTTGVYRMDRDRGDWEPCTWIECVYICSGWRCWNVCRASMPSLRDVELLEALVSDEKVQILKDEFGYDEAFNYRKESDFDAALAK